MRQILTISLLLAISLCDAQFEGIRTLTPEQAQEVRRPVEANVFGASAEELPGIEAELLKIFQSSATTLEGQQYACRMLRHCASNASVPVLAPELGNPELSEFVRRVFQSLETPTANDALIQALAAGPNVGIIGTLGQIGSEKKIQALESSIATAAQRQPDAEACTKPLIAAYKQARGEQQLALIRALGSIGGAEAQAVLTEAIASPDAAATDAAIRGLCNWPNTEVADQPLDLAKNADLEKQKVLALRGYIRLANTYSQEKDALPMCKKAAALTDRPEELKSIIACAKRFRSRNAINLLAPMLENPAIVDEAGQAMIVMARHRTTKQMAIPHLERYIELTQNKQMKKSAQNALKQLK